MDRRSFYRNLREMGFHEPFNWEEVKAFYLCLILEHLNSDFTEIKITNEELDISVKEL